LHRKVAKLTRHPAENRPPDRESHQSQIENLTNLDQIPSKVKVIALPVKWTTESAPARVIALLD